jgi:hypothetical protein
MQPEESPENLREDQWLERLQQIQRGLEEQHRLEANLAQESENVKALLDEQGETNNALTAQTLHNLHVSVVTHSRLLLEMDERLIAVERQVAWLADRMLSTTSRKRFSLGRRQG